MTLKRKRKKRNDKRSVQRRIQKVSRRWRAKLDRTVADLAYTLQRHRREKCEIEDTLPLGKAISINAQRMHSNGNVYAVTVSFDADMIRQGVQYHARVGAPYRNSHMVDVAQCCHEIMRDIEGQLNPVLTQVLRGDKVTVGR